MKKLMLGILLFSLVGCNNSEKDNSENDTNKDNDMSEIQILNKVFIAAEKHFYNEENCNFELACDCCSAQLLINNDSTFIFKDICLSQKDITFGELKMIGEEIVLSFNEKRILIKEHPEVDLNSEDPHYTIVDTIFNGKDLVFSLQDCKKGYFFEGKEIDMLLSESELNYKEIKADLDEIIEK